MKPHLLTFILGFLIFSCNQPAQESAPSVFEHEVAAPAKPWNSEQFLDNSPLAFAIISDLTGGERAGIFAKAVER